MNHHIHKSSESKIRLISFLGSAHQFSSLATLQWWQGSRKWLRLPGNSAAHQPAPSQFTLLFMLSLTDKIWPNLDEWGGSEALVGEFCYSWKETGRQLLPLSPVWMLSYTTLMLAIILLCIFHSTFLLFFYNHSAVIIFRWLLRGVDEEGIFVDDLVIDIYLFGENPVIILTEDMWSDGGKLPSFQSNAPFYTDVVTYAHEALCVLISQSPITQR